MRNLIYTVIIVSFICQPAFSAWLEYQNGMWIKDDYKLSGNKLFVTFKYDSNSENVKKRQNYLKNLDNVIEEMIIDCSTGAFDVNYTYLNKNNNLVFQKVHNHVNNEKAKQMGLEMCSEFKK